MSTINLFLICLMTLSMMLHCDARKVAMDFGVSVQNRGIDGDEYENTDSKWSDTKGLHNTRSLDSEVCEPDMMTKMVEGMLPSFTKKMNPLKLPDIMQKVPDTDILVSFNNGFVNGLGNLKLEGTCIAKSGSQWTMKTNIKMDEVKAGYDASTNFNLPMVGKRDLEGKVSVELRNLAIAIAIPLEIVTGEIGELKAFDIINVDFTSANIDIHNDGGILDTILETVTLNVKGKFKDIVLAEIEQQIVALVNSFVAGKTLADLGLGHFIGK